MDNCFAKVHTVLVCSFSLFILLKNSSVHILLPNQEALYVHGVAEISVIKCLWFLSYHLQFYPFLSYQLVLTDFNAAFLIRHFKLWPILRSHSYGHSRSWHHLTRALLFSQSTSRALMTFEPRFSVQCCDCAGCSKFR